MKLFALKLSKLAAFTALLSSTAFVSTLAMADDCQAVAAAKLVEKGVQNAQLSYVDVKTNGSNSNVPLAYDFYYKSPTCGDNGYVVVTTTSYCYVQQVYTRYACKISGLPHYGF